MSNPRTPMHIAVATGRTEHDAKRFRDRVVPENEPLGEPSAGLSPREHELWRQMLMRMWWLREHHRWTFTLLVRLYAEIEYGSINTKLLGVYAKYARMLGANQPMPAQAESKRRGASEFTGR